jgi:hypothetical protein
VTKKYVQICRFRLCWMKEEGFEKHGHEHSGGLPCRGSEKLTHHCS